MAAFATSASAADNYFADPGGNELYVGGFYVYIVNVSSKASASPMLFDLYVSSVDIRSRTTPSEFWDPSLVTTQR
jgi:hypothetical protein